MKKRLFVFMCVLFIVSSASGLFATEVRMWGLGLSGYEWMIGTDTTLMKYNPAEVTRHPQQVTGVFYPYYDAEVILKPSDNLSLYYQLGQYTSGWLSNMTGDFTVFDDTPVGTVVNGNSVDEADTAYNPTLNFLNLLVGMDMGGMKLGFAAGCAVRTNDIEETDTAASPNESDEQTLELKRAGYEFYLAGGVTMGDLDAGLQFTGFGRKNSGKYEQNYAVGLNSEEEATLDAFGFALDLFARYNMALAEKNVLHLALLGYYAMVPTNLSESYILEATGDEYTVDTTFKRNYFGLSLGASDEMKFGDKVLAFVGTSLSFSGNTRLQEGETDAAGVESSYGDRKYSSYSLYIPVLVGAEFEIVNNLIGRIGAGRSILVWNGTTTDDDETGDEPVAGDQTITKTSELSSTGVNAVIGMSWNIGKLRAEWVLNSNLFAHGPYIFSGVPLLNTAFSVTYFL